MSRARILVVLLDDVHASSFCLAGQCLNRVFTCTTSSDDSTQLHPLLGVLPTGVGTSLKGTHIQITLEEGQENGGVMSQVVYLYWSTGSGHKSRSDGKSQTRSFRDGFEYILQQQALPQC